MKKVVITVSEFFPKGHPMEGEPTHFIEKIKNGQKLHTIRLNLQYWEKQIAKVTAGDAVLCVRTWSGKPYASKQVQRLELGANDGVGIESVQMVKRSECSWAIPIVKTPKGEIDYKRMDEIAKSLPDIKEFPSSIKDYFYVRPKNVFSEPVLQETIIRNDGLSQFQFDAWFNPLPKEPCGIIHFTNFRYSKA